MAKHIIGDNISIAWIRAIDYLLKQGRHECYNLLVEITNPLTESEEINNSLNRVLEARGNQCIETVANTIFPNELYLNSDNREVFYSKYFSIVKRLRKIHSKNRYGIYFERLVLWPVSKEKTINQIENIIKRLIQQKQIGHPLRVVYEASIIHPILDAIVYTPGLDNKYGFPCLSFLSFKLEENKLNLTAVYRNHYFVERAYGNYLGLARLLRFVSQETDCEVGNLCVLSTHGELDKSTVTYMAELRDRYKESLK